MSEFKAIVAVAQNGVIGSGMKIPWHISEDFKHFKRTTMGGVVAMGRRTWESLGGRPLPGRQNVVITSRGGKFEGAEAVRGLEELAERYRSDPRTVWICGGAEIYRQALPMCSEIVLSRVKMAPAGDVFFPDISADFEPSEKILESEQFDVIIYRKKRKQPAFNNLLEKPGPSA